jgi:quercetin 2,3-dioxygenase
LAKKCHFFTNIDFRNALTFAVIIHNQNFIHMKRRNFIATSILAGTATTLSAKVFAQNEDPQKPFIVKAGKSRFEDFNPTGVLKVSGKDTNGEFCVFETKNEMGPMAGPPLHMHKYQDEVFQIIEGEFLFQVGNEKIKASAGDFVFGPRTVPHTFYQLSKKAHMIFSYNPAGKMEEIMKEMTKLMPKNPEGFAKACAENDVPFVGPPMTGK